MSTAKRLVVEDRERIEEIKAGWPDWEERFATKMGPVTTPPATDMSGRPRKFEIGKWSSARKQKKERTKE